MLKQKKSNKNLFPNELSRLIVVNYQYVDVLYDYILSIGMKPFVELGFMPSALACGSKTAFWWKGNITPPKD